LKKGSVIRIVVPDIAKYIRAYYENDCSVVGLSKKLPDSWVAADILNHTFRQGGEHKFGCDFVALEKVLFDSGFRIIEMKQYGVSLDLDLKFDQTNHALYSLYVKAVK
jgi:hypothetical protein